MTAPDELGDDRRDLRYRAVLVLDFDGTVCLGDGPVWAYADAVLPHLAPAIGREVSGALVAYLSGHEHPNGHLDAYPDGYSAIAALAGPHVAPDLLSDAYANSRLALEDADVDIHAPDGLADLLDAIGRTVRRVVVTNAPSTGLDTALKRLGLAAQIDEVVSSAGKPPNSAAVLGTLLDGAPAATLMSVGDFWLNDIEPALELGCATAFIDRSGRDLRPAHVRGRTIDELYPAVEAWARAPQAFLDSHSPIPTPDRST
ncbi:MAG: HAD family hydrolase [Jatrophihabitantaceae bacterium]